MSSTISRPDWSSDRIVIFALAEFVKNSTFATGALTLEQGTPNVATRMRKDLFVYGPETRRARDHFLVEQAGRCAICGTIERPLVVDHEHSDYGLVRGLLCDFCNQGLGFLGDALDRLELAVAYLQEHESRNREYEVSPMWIEREVPTGTRSRLPGYHLRARDQQIVAAIRAGERTDAIALRFDLSVSAVNRIFRRDAA